MKKGMFLRIFFGETDIVLVYQSKILKIERVRVNLRKRVEKKLFCGGVHHNSQQNHSKQKNQNAFIKGDVSRGNPRRIFFSISQFLVTLGSQNPDFRSKKSANLLL